MPRPFVVVLAVVVVALAAAALPPAPAGAQGEGALPPRVGAPPLEGIDVAGDLPAPPRAALAGALRRVAVELAAPPAAAAVPGGGDPAAQLSRAAVVDAQQAAFRSRATALDAGIEVLGATRVARNLVLVEAPAAAVDLLAADPAVVGVEAVRDAALALPEVRRQVGADAAAAAAGVDGTGVRIGVVDSGVDYTHAALGGAGTSQAYERAYGLTFAEAAAAKAAGQPVSTATANTRTSDTGGAYFPTAEVVAGADFVGEAWTGDPGSPRERSDPNPIDIQSHGTHVAHIAAGAGGLAPGATVVAAKACASFSGACSGIALLQGVDYVLDPNGDGAMDDAVDVINLSLGSPYGTAESDPLSEMVEAAAQRGVLPVVSAGNSGDLPYAHGTPAAAPSALSVAETRVPSRGAGIVTASSSRGPTNGSNLAKPEIAAPGAATSAIAATGTATEPFGGTSGAAPVVSGVAALLLGNDQPDRTPAQLKALLQTSAAEGLVRLDGALAAVTRVGTGEVRADRAVDAPVAVRTEDGTSASLSFGFLEVAGDDVTRTLDLVVENLDVVPRTYDVEAELRFADDVANGAVSVSTPSTVVVPPGASTTVPVTLEIDGSRLRRWTLDAGVQGANGPLLSTLEYDGVVRFRPVAPADGPELAAPFSVLPRAAGDVTADDTAVRPGSDGTDRVVLRNTGIEPATAGTYTLVATSPRLPEGSPGLDLRALGVSTASDPACTTSGIAMSIAITTEQRLVTPQAPFMFDVLVDTDADSTPDFEIYNLDASGRLADGRNAVFVADLDNPAAAPTFVFATDHPTNSPNTVLPVCFEQLGLSAADLGRPLTLDAAALDFYGSGDVTDAFGDVVVRPGAERFQAASVEVPAGGTATLEVTDGGAEGTYGIGILALLDAPGSDGGRAGAVAGRESLVLEAGDADPEPPQEPIEQPSDGPPAEPVEPEISPSPSPAPASEEPAPPPGPGPAPSQEPSPQPSAAPSPAPSEPAASPTPTPSPAASASPQPAPSPVPPEAGDDTVERLAGAGRIATAVAISQRAFPDGSAPVALLARADAYPDALAGSPLATALGGPLLLNPADQLDGTVAAELQRLGAREVVLLGGETALSPAVSAGLADRGLAVRRVGGGNRFDTAVRIAQEVASLRSSGEVVVVEGANPDPARGFPDALSAAGLAASEGLPILLATAGSVPDETARALRPDVDVLVVGGEVAVSRDVEAQLDERSGTVRRLSGATRYATSAAVLAEAESRGLDPSTLFLATGLFFPDALAAGAAAGAFGTVVLLVDGGDLAASPASRDALAARRGVIDVALIAGGDAAVSRAVEDEVRRLIRPG